MESSRAAPAPTVIAIAAVLLLIGGYIGSYFALVRAVVVRLSAGRGGAIVRVVVLVVALGHQTSPRGSALGSGRGGYCEGNEPFAGAERLELPTCGFGIRCSTN